MHFKKVTYFIACIVFFSSSAWSQEKIRLKKLYIEDGLSQSSIHEIYQDVEGLIWIATEDGLNSYDGYKFTIYRPSSKNKQSICNNWINEIEEDSDGNLWLSTYYGLSKWNRTKNNFTNFLPETTSEITGREFSRIHYSKDHKLWFINDSEIGYYSTETKHFKNYSINKNHFPVYEFERYNYLLEDGFGKIWATTVDSGIVVFKNNVPTRILVNDGKGLVSNVINHAMVGFDGEIWLSSPNGLMHYDSKAEKFITISNDRKSIPILPTNNVRSAVFDNDNNLWVVLQGNGLFKIDSKTKAGKHFITSNKTHGLGTNFYDKCFKDKEGRLWFYGLIQKYGLTIYSPHNNKFINYNSGKDPYSLSSNNPISFLAGRNGEIWIGTDVGINIYNPRLENFIHISRNPYNDSTIDQYSIRHILKDKKGRTWAGTTSALNMKEGDNRGFVTFPFNNESVNGLQVKSISKIVEDKKGRIWIGAGTGAFLYNEVTKKFQNIKVESYTSKTGNAVRYIFLNKDGEVCITYNHTVLAKLDEKKMVFKEINNFPFLEERTITCVKELQQNKLFFGTYSSFYIYDNDKKTFKYYPYHYYDNTSISNPEVNDALIQNDSILWIATANGLNRFNVTTEKFTYYFIEDGLPNQYIYNLLMDSNQNVWMSSNKGISMFNPGTGFFKNYDVNDGLQSNEFNGGAASSNGKEFFFGGVNGYNYFIPSKVEINHTPPLLYFTDLTINNKKIIPGDTSKILEKRIEDTKKIKFAEGIANLTIEFVGLDYTSENALSYFYSLSKSGEIVDTDWYNIGNQRSISLTNPEFGDYVLKIQAVNKDGIESEIKQIEINILPPFYKTNWFKITSVIAFILLIFIIYRIRINAIKKQKKELQQLVENRTHEVVEQRDEAEKQKKIAIQQKEEVGIQKEIIEIKNKEIIDSIHYAKRIQVALLKSEEHESQHLPAHFILFKPKDIVSGDFYWALEKQDYLYVAAGDCTGHGVPGAFMSMLGIAYLNEINAGEEVFSTSTILDKLRNKIVENLSGEKGENKDGMDMSLYKLNIKTNEIEWSGSNNPLWIVTQNLDNYSDILNQQEHKITVFKTSETATEGLIEIKPDKQSICYSEDAKPFTKHVFKLHKNDSIYIFTDGFADQFGGEKGKKFKYRSLKQLILEIEKLPMEQQKKKMNATFENWRGPLEQIDDVCLIGLKI